MNHHLLLLFICLLISFQFPLNGQNIVINELMAENDSIIADEDGEYVDWVELYNTSNETVSLYKWHLSDNTSNIQKWQFPDVLIPPGDYLLVFLSGKEDSTTLELHSDFKLGGGIEPLLLSDSSGMIIDSVQARCIPENISWGRKVDGSVDFYYFTTPSPGFSNNNNQITTIEIVSDSVFLSHKTGFYTEPFLLEIKHSSDKATIKYTLDGEEPLEEGFVYDKPLLVSSRKGEENYFSDIKTSPYWEPPVDEVFKATTICVQAVSDGCPASKPVNCTFFVDTDIKNRYNFPIVSIITEKSNFFGKNKGIYVPGNLFSEDSPESTGNYLQHGSAWERPIHMEYISPQGELLFKIDIGARIHGRGSRKKPQKTLRLHANNDYGAEYMNYRFFDDLQIDSFKRLLLRTTQGDLSGTCFKDEISHEIVKELNLDVQASQPIIVFINGEYWGIHNMRERQDKYYIHNHYPDIDYKNLDLLSLSYNVTEITEGDTIAYTALLDFVQENDVKKEEVFREIESRIDIKNYIDYYIAQFYFSNNDWPESNIKYWREREDNSRWRWLFFDCDYCMMNENYDDIKEYVIEHDKFYRHNKDATFLFRQLLKNEHFRLQFYSRFTYLLQTKFSSEHVIEIINQFEKQYAPLMGEHIRRWNHPSSFNVWLENVDNLKNFALKRPPRLLSQLKQLFGSPFELIKNESPNFYTIQTSYNETVPGNIFLYDMLGRTVYYRSFINKTELNQIQINNKGLTGIYILKIQFGKQIFTEKVFF